MTDTFDRIMNSVNCNANRHKFEARYDYGAASVPWEKFETIKISPEAIEAFRTKTYVHDVCVRCGKVIERIKTGQVEKVGV